MSEALANAISAHRAGDVDGARTIALAGLAIDPDDVTLLHFLGMIEAKSGRLAAAQALFTRATVASPEFGPALVSLARLLDRSGDMAALAALDRPAPAGAMGNEYLLLRARARDATGDTDGAATDHAELAARNPGDRAIRLGAARALADASRLGEAEHIYRDILAGDPADAEALLGLVGIFESLSRSLELAGAFAAARKAGASPPLVALGGAIALREAGDYPAALARLDGARGLLPDATFQQMRGDLADRAGEVDIAVAAFRAMNAADLAATPQALDGVRRYRTELDAQLVALDGPRPLPPPTERRAPPIFLVGFPRSGTTLLDTFLMGHADLQVHEERPFLDAAAAVSNDAIRQSLLDPGQIAAMRAAYWRALDRDTDRPNSLQVDKNPLASARALLIAAMFPGARFLFALRHPCDVVLSCFFTRFRLNWAVASFLSVEDAAVTYDRVMRLWTASRERLALDVHEVRYERLVADPEGVLRDVAEFAGIAFDPAMLDHRAVARGRGLISSPSHAQVTAPLHGRSVGRWRRYREILDPVLPSLEPWCQRFGYDL